MIVETSKQQVTVRFVDLKVRIDGFGVWIIKDLLVRCKSKWVDEDWFLSFDEDGKTLRQIKSNEKFREDKTVMKDAVLQCV